MTRPLPGLNHPSPGAVRLPPLPSVAPYPSPALHVADPSSRILPPIHPTPYASARYDSRVHPPLRPPYPAPLPSHSHHEHYSYPSTPHHSHHYPQPHHGHSGPYSYPTGTPGHHHANTELAPLRQLGRPADAYSTGLRAHDIPSPTPHSPHSPYPPGSVPSQPVLLHSPYAINFAPPSSIPGLHPATQATHGSSISAFTATHGPPGLSSIPHHGDNSSSSSGAAMVAARANRGAIRSTSRSAAHAMERGPSRGRGTRSRRRQRPENLQASIRRLERVVQALQIRYIILCGYTDNPLIPPDLFLVPASSRPADSAHTGGGHRDHNPGNDPLHPDTLPRPTATSASPCHPAASSSASLPPSGRTTSHHYHHHHPLVSSSTAAGSGPHAPVRPVSTAATTAALAQVTLYSPGTYHHSPETVRSFLELQQERHRLAWYYLRTRCEADCAEFLLRRNSV